MMTPQEIDAERRRRIQAQIDYLAREYGYDRARHDIDVLQERLAMIPAGDEEGYHALPN